jgi:hypothetical protein
MLLLCVIGAAILNFAFGINIGQMVVSTVVFLLTTLVEFWKTIVNTFKFDNKEQITALAVILFILMIFGFMAFNLNTFGSAGTISVGSGEVSANAEGGQGSGNFFTDGVNAGGSSVTSTTSGSALTTTSNTATTLKPHCDNQQKDDGSYGTVDEGETGIDCGGVDCSPCDCFIDGDGRNWEKCGDNCPSKCSCTPTGLNYDDCEFGYCCPTTGTYSKCFNRCIQFPIGDTEVTTVEGQCNQGDCMIEDLYVILPVNDSEVNGNALLDWY